VTDQGNSLYESLITAFFAFSIAYSSFLPTQRPVGARAAIATTLAVAAEHGLGIGLPLDRLEPEASGRAKSQFCREYAKVRFS
jgi:hypothetical protein